MNTPTKPTPAIGFHNKPIGVGANFGERVVMFGFLVVCGLLFGDRSIATAAETPMFAPVQAELIRPRDGLGNFFAKLRGGETVRVAYLGGSITAAPGWRIQSREWLTREFSPTRVEEIDAAIGGTGSDLGVFRVEHDALRHKPDLLFVEFAVNDGGATPEQIWRSMEGIVRQTWAANPRTDVCFVYTFRVGYEQDLQAGFCPRAASAMELLADHYGIPSVNFALKVCELQQAGKLVFKSAEPTEAGVIRFSEDGVHPLEAGHRVYSEVLAEAFKQMSANSQPVHHAAKMATPFVADNWSAAKMVPIKQSMLSGDWTHLEPTADLPKSFSRRMGEIWETTQPGSRLSFKFRGSRAQVYDLLAPDGGQVNITVDGQPQSKPVPRFDSYCTYARIATLPVADGLDPNAVHTVTIEVDAKQPDRSPVAFRLKDPEVELKSPKFQGTKFRVSQILVLGDFVE
jgi:lysophospholipase L1-like esterase